MSREGYKMTELGEIPREWEVEPIGTFIDSLNAGVSVNSEDRPRKAGEYGILKTSSVTYGIWKPEENKVVLEEELGRARVSPKRDRIIISRMNTPQMVGASAYIPKDMEDLFLPDRLWQIEPKENQKVSMRWLSYSISSDNVRMQITNIATGTSGSMKNMSKTAFLGLPIIVPTYIEQQKIAEILSTVDEQIMQTDALIEKTKELKKGLMQRLLTKGIGHTKFRVTEIGEIPIEWEVKPLSNVCDVNPESLTSKTDSDLKINYIDIESVSTGSISGIKEYLFGDAPSRARRVVRKKDVIISTVRPYLRAFAMIQESLNNLICSTGFAVIRAKNENVPEYLYQCTLSDCFLSQLTNKMVGSNYPAVNASDVKETLVPVPPPIEQRKIASILCSVDQQIEEYESKEQKLNVLKKALMQKLLTGKIRVNVQD